MVEEQFSKEVKLLRAEAQKTIEKIDILFINTFPGFEGGRELSLAKTKLQEGKMWLGQVLGKIPDNVDLNKERDAKEMQTGSDENLEKN